MHFHIVENTPGYLPDSDEDYRVETEAEAVEAVAEQVASYVESVEEVEATATVSGAGTTYVLVGRNDRMHDLGRVFEAMACTEDHPEA
jgi:hypothetical protein